MIYLNKPLTFRPDLLTITVTDLSRTLRSTQSRPACTKIAMPTACHLLKTTDSQRKFAKNSKLNSMVLERIYKNSESCKQNGKSPFNAMHCSLKYLKVVIS